MVNQRLYNYQWMVTVDVPDKILDYYHMTENRFKEFLKDRQV